MTALADNAMGLSYAHRVGRVTRLLTVSLSIDFLASAKLGQWIEVDTTFVKTGRRLSSRKPLYGPMASLALAPAHRS